MTPGSNADNRAVLRNAFTQYGSIVINIGLGLLLTPALLRGLGEQKFGYYTVVLALSGYIGLGELGLGTATVRRIAAEFAKDDDRSVSQVGSTARAIYLGTATTGAVIVLVATILLGSLLRIPDAALVQSQLALMILGLAASVSFLFMVFPAILIGSGRSDLLTVAGSTIAVVGSITQIMAVTMTHDLRIVAAVSATSSILASFASRRIALRRFPTLTIRIRNARWSIAKELLGSGWRNAVITISALAAYNADVLIVGAYLSIAAVTAYGVATKAAGVMSTITFRISEVLVPTYSHHDATGDNDKLYVVYVETTLASMAMALPAAVVLVAFGDPLLSAWLGHTPAGAPAVLALLALALVVAVPGGTAFYMLSGVNELRFAVKASLISGVLNAGLGVALTPVVGLTGPAIATLVMRGVFDLVILPVHVCRVLGKPVAPWAREFTSVVLPSVVATGIAGLGLHLLVGSGPKWQVALSCAAIGITHVATFANSAGPERRHRYAALVRSRTHAST